MFFKEKKKIIITISSVLMLLYIFIVPTPMGNDLYFLPIWAKKIDPTAFPNETNTIKNDYVTVKEKFDEHTPIPFILGNFFGYFSTEGEILKTSKTENRITASSEYWAEYSSKSSQIDVHAPYHSLKDSPVFKINGPGYAHFDGDKFYVFEPDGYAVSHYDNRGEKKWYRAHTAPITAFQSSKSGTVIGYSDGLLTCIDNHGNTRFSFYPGGSNYQVIMGAAISDDGNKVFCISGLEKQRAILISINANKYKIIQHVYLKKDLRRQIFADFDAENEFVVFESGDGIGIIDCNNRQVSFLEEYGSLISIGEKPQKNILTILIQNENTCSLVAVEPPNMIIGKTSFISRNAFLRQDGNRIYIGTDKKILALNVRRIK